MRTYSERGVVRHYVDAVEEIGLWPSEKALFGHYLRKDDAILDLGCGAGRTTFGLMRAGYRGLTGLDISWRLVGEAGSRARRQGGGRFICGDSCHLPFRDNSFDGAIFSFNGLMAIPGTANRVAALREVRRVVRPGGTFVFTTGERTDNPFWHRQKEQWDQGTRNPVLREFGDVLVRGGPHWRVFLHFPTVPEVASLIQRAGWRLIERRSREQICYEPPRIDRFAGHCLFWTVSNPKPMAG